MIHVLFLHGDWTSVCDVKIPVFSLVGGIYALERRFSALEKAGLTRCAEESFISWALEVAESLIVYLKIWGILGRNPKFKLNLDQPKAKLLR